MPKSQRGAFPYLDRKEIEVRFDAHSSSSEGGPILLRACNQALSLANVRTGVLQNPRQLGETIHTLRELRRQRVLGLALSYANGNDVARLKSNPMLGRSLDAILATGPT